MSRASDAAYRLIRERILSGALAPLTQLTEEEVAELCGVSRTPVREALRRLEAEMLVRRTDTSRTFVSGWTAEEVQEIFELRAMLESRAAARAAIHITPDQLDEMRRCNERIGEAIAGSVLDVEGFVGGNRLFHAALIEAARSERLMKMHKLLVEQAILIRTARRYDRAGLSASQQDHEDLLYALRTHDAEWAAAIMSGHILRAYHVTAANGLLTHQGEQAGETEIPTTEP